MIRARLAALAWLVLYLAAAVALAEAIVAAWHLGHQGAAVTGSACGAGATLLWRVTK